MQIVMVEKIPQMKKKINRKFYLFEELEDSIKQLKINLYINGGKSLLRREIRFKNKNK